MSAKPTEKYVRCIDGFIHNRTIVKGGQILAANDRMVKGREHLFVPLDDDENVAKDTVGLDDRMVTGRTLANRVVAGKGKKAKG